MRKQQYIPYGGAVREQHHQPIHPDAFAGGRRSRGEPRGARADHDDVRMLPDEARAWVERLEAESGESGRARGVADYVAGMTDRFALAEHERLLGPGEGREGESG